MATAEPRPWPPRSCYCNSEHRVTSQRHRGISREKSGYTVLLCGKEKRISLHGQLTAVGDGCVSQRSSYLRRQQLQEQLDEEKLWPVVTEEIPHSVHEFGGLAVTEPLQREKVAGSLSASERSNDSR